MKISPLPTRTRQGAFPEGDGATFRVWAPRLEALSLDVEGLSPMPMRRGEDGLFQLHVGGLRSGARYGFRLPDGRLLPDPASRFQPGSVHERSQLMDLAFDFQGDAFRGHPADELLFYELHVGTWTPEGTLDAARRALPRLAELGVTAVELMPLAAFDGERGWGYDGVQPYAVHRAYGGPTALAAFVRDAHALGLSVFLDVVYNHFGPSGCYLREFGSYFTDRQSTPWGEAIDFTVPQVRDYIVENALFWLRTFHLDGLRLDAVHAIIDPSPRNILEELAEAVAALSEEQGRPLHLVAESDLNAPHLVRPTSEGGFGLTAQWSDDFHHALHALLTGERAGYYVDFGELEALARAFRDGYAFTGQFSIYRGRTFGAGTAGIEARRFVVAAQNHDQIGNRARGERLTALVSPEAARLAAAAVLLSPFTPLLFMGEPSGEVAPFLYFTGFPDERLGRAVTEGRRREFQKFRWQGEIPDPQAPETFERSACRDDPERDDAARRAWEWHRALIAMRRSIPGFAQSAIGETDVQISGRALLISRAIAGRDALLALHFSETPAETTLPEGRWRRLLDSHAGEETALHSDEAFQGRLLLGPWQALFLERVG